MKVIEGGVTAAQGFLAAGLSAGIKKGNTKDMAMLYSVPCEAAGIYNQYCKSGTGEMGSENCI